MSKYLLLPMVFLASTAAFSVEGASSENDLIQKIRESQLKNSNILKERKALDVKKDEAYQIKMKPLSEQAELGEVQLKKEYDAFLIKYFKDLKENADQLKVKYEQDTQSLNLIKAIYRLYSDVKIEIGGGTKPGSISGTGSIDAYGDIEDRLYKILEKAEESKTMPDDISNYFSNSQKHFQELMTEKDRVYNESQKIKSQISKAYNDHSKDFEDQRQKLIEKQVAHQREGEKALEKYKETYGYPVEDDDMAPVSDEEHNLFKESLKEQGKLNLEPGVDKKIEELKNLEKLKLPPLENEPLDLNK